MQWWKWKRKVYNTAVVDRARNMELDNYSVILPDVKSGFVVQMLSQVNVLSHFPISFQSTGLNDVNESNAIDFSILTVKARVNLLQLIYRQHRFRPATWRHWAQVTEIHKAQVKYNSVVDPCQIWSRGSPLTTFYYGPNGAECCSLQLAKFTVKWKNKHFENFFDCSSNKINAMLEIYWGLSLVLLRVVLKENLSNLMFSFQQVYQKHRFIKQWNIKTWKT